MCVCVCLHIVLTLSAEIIYHERWRGMAKARKLWENNFALKSFRYVVADAYADNNN